MAKKTQQNIFDDDEIEDMEAATAERANAQTTNSDDGVENPPELTAEDEAILDDIWDRLGKEDAEKAT